MQFITEFLLRLVNLAEAEGRLIRASIIRIAVAIVCLAVAGAVFIIAILAGGAAVVVGLSEVMPTAWALTIVTMMYAMVSLGLVFFARRDLND